jgi:hypothetical protein
VAVPERKAKQASPEGPHRKHHACDSRLVQVRKELVRASPRVVNSLAAAAADGTACVFTISRAFEQEVTLVLHTGWHPGVLHNGLTQHINKVSRMHGLSL